MSAMVLDAIKVNAYVIPNLSKAKTTLTDASKYGNSIVKSTPDSPLASRSNLREARIRNTASDLAKRLGVISNNINTISLKLDNKVEKAKLIEKKNKAKTTAISAAVGAVAGIAGAAIGAATGGVKGAVVGAAVGAAAGVAVKRTNIVSSIGKALKNTGAKIAKNVGNFFSGVWKGIKNIGKSIWDACKKIANKVVSFVKEKISPLLKKIMNGVWKGIKFLGRCAATVVNLAISLVEGIVSFVEAIGDVVLLVVGGVCSIVTAVADVVRGVCTGEWDWKCTGAVWKKWIMPWVGYDWTSKAFSWNSGSFIDNAAFSWAKRDTGIGYKIGKGVGYYVAMIAATVITAGAAGAASGAAAAGSATAKVAGTLATKAVAQGVMGGLASVGKNAQKNYNSTIDKKVTAHYVEELMLANPGLTEDEAAEIVAYNLENGLYADKAAVRKSAMDNISGAEIAKGNIKAVGSGIIDGSIYYLGGTYGKALGNKMMGTKAFQFMAKDGSKLATKIATEKGAEAVAKYLGGTSIKMSKAFVSEGYNSLSILGGDGKYNWDEAFIDAGSIVIAETMAFKMGDISAGAKGITGKIANSKLGQTISHSKPVEAIKNSKIAVGTKNFVDNFKKGYDEHFAKTAKNYKLISEGKGAETGLSTGKQVLTVLDQGVHEGLGKANEKAVKDATSNTYDNVIAALPSGT